MTKKKCKLETGKFYHSYGGGRHPSYLYKKNEPLKTYTSIKFGTTERKDSVPIHSIDNKNKSFASKRPFEGTRKDYGDHELLGLSIDDRDYPIIEKIKRRKPKLSKRAKEKYKKMPSSD